MMFIPNKPEIWQALREKGLEEDARGLTRMTGFGLWMFWVYFAYLALFGLIALVWPSYPGIARHFTTIAGIIHLPGSGPPGSGRLKSGRHGCPVVVAQRSRMIDWLRQSSLRRAGMRPPALPIC